MTFRATHALTLGILLLSASAMAAALLGGPASPDASLLGRWTLACSTGGGKVEVVFRSDGTASIGDSPYVYTADESGPPPHELDLVAPNGLRLVGLYGPGAEGGSVALILRLAEEGRPQDLGAESLRLFRRRPDAEAFARSAYEARVLGFRLTAW